jgi:hypothetical protein
LLDTEDKKAIDAIRLAHVWRADPFLYLKECLGITKIWKLQADLLDALPRAIADNKPIYIASGHGLGKDFICSCVANWFLDCFIPSKVILTAPSDRQVKRIMWAETLSRFNGKLIRLWGKAFTNPYIEIRREDWFLLGFATKDTGAAAESGGGKFQGLRAAKHMCVIVTEAQAVEDNIYDQIDAVSTAEFCLRIYIGNPTRKSGKFAQGLRDKANNIVFHFSCLDSPNYLQRKIVIPGVVSYAWVMDKLRKWADGDINSKDPRWVGRVLGQIPDNALSNTFTQEWIDHCRERCGFLHIHSADAGVALDSAGEGVDDNIIMSGKGGEVMDTFAKTLMTPTENALKAVEMCRAVHGSFIIVDCDGVGIRDYQELCNLPNDYLKGIEIIKFHGSAPSTVMDGDRPLYANLRCEASFITQERGFAGKCSIEEKDKELIDDLMEEEYFENKKGLLQIEPKEDLKERLERSPGRGDAYKMLQWAFAQNFEDKTYQDTNPNTLPRYAESDADITRFDGQSLPRYGRTD